MISLEVEEKIENNGGYNATGTTEMAEGQTSNWELSAIRHA